MKRMRKMLLILAALLVLVPASAEAAAEKYRGYTISEKGAIAYNKPNMITGKPRFLFGGSHERRTNGKGASHSAQCPHYLQRRQYHGLVAETQRGSRVPQSDAGVSLLNDGTQQVSLGKRLLSAIQRARSVGEIPTYVLYLPVAVDFLVGKDVVQGDAFVQLRTLEVAGQLKQIVIEAPCIDIFLHILSIVEECSHGTFVVTVLIDKLHISTLRLEVRAFAGQFLVGEIHVPHVML